MRHVSVDDRYALYAELLDLGWEAAMAHDDPQERARALERLARGWAHENRERDAMWVRMSRTLSKVRS